MRKISTKPILVSRRWRTLGNAASLSIFVIIIGASLSGCSTLFGSKPEPPRREVKLRRKAPHGPVVVQGNVVAEDVPYEPQLPLRDTPKVRQYFYAFRDSHRSYIEDSLGRYKELSPMMDQILRKYGLPLELASVALIESRFDPTARSPMGAVGMWQLMATTAKVYGLRVSLFVDDRKNPEKSTEAAAQYLADLYDQFGDWLLVLAAYNSGPARVAAALRSTENADFFELDRKGLIPTETSNFVQRVIAAALIFRRLEAYGFTDFSSADPAKTLDSTSNTAVPGAGNTPSGPVPASKVNARSNPKSAPLAPKPKPAKSNRSRGSKGKSAAAANPAFGEEFDSQSASR